MTNQHIRDFENAIKECFVTGVQALWYGGTEGKYGDDPNHMFIAIHEDENWCANKCILRDWYFNYEAFNKLPVRMDCERYGVYIFLLPKKE